MKIANFMTATGEIQWGIVDDVTQTIFGSADLEEAYFTFLPETITELIEQGSEGLLLLSTALEKHAEAPLLEPYPLSEVTLLAPLQVKKNIFCVGKNYADHIQEFEQTDSIDIPSSPIFFTKPPTTIIGPNEAIDSHPEITSSVDYEGELAVIIGQRGTNIPENEAMDYVFGYTIINDVSARDLQKRQSQWFIGKSLDTFCPMGPCIYLSNKKEEDFQIQTYVNDELRQSASTEDLIFSIPHLISTLSQGLTLEPGDIISTGTPQGVGMGFNPPRFLRRDDEVSITIDKIGTLRNTVK